LVIVPWVEEINGSPWVRIPDDIGFPVNRVSLDEAVRE